MWLFVGLGNPGPKYTLTRHNIGFLGIDQFLRGFPPSREKSEKKSLCSKVTFEDQPILCVKPQTFMNLSGEAVQALMTYYKIPLERLVVLHDEVDLPFGKIKLQKSRGHGGNNGIRNIHSKIGKDYMRVRMGVGKSMNPNIDTAAHVLQNFNDSEMKQMPDFLNKAGDLLCDIVSNGFEKTATQYNSE